ncbi:hypothetical protein J25TS5_21210 [Paenibacillus faecis]|nr:hypothetical protein [Paenibacillus faecis]GIO85189.1 hypothetical protein J25TS5_21210 [Paenibacillus faecis]
MDKKNNAKHSSKQVKRKSGVPNLNAEFANADSSKETSQKSKR